MAKWELFLIKTANHVELDMMTGSLCLSLSVYLSLFFLSHSCILSSIENFSVGVSAPWHIAFLDVAYSYEEDVIAAEVVEWCRLTQLCASGVAFINTASQLITFHLVTPPLTLSYFLK